MDGSMIRFSLLAAILFVLGRPAIGEAGFQVEIQVQNTSNAVLSNNFYFPTSNPQQVLVASGTAQGSSGITVSGVPTTSSAVFTSNVPGTVTMAYDEGVFTIQNTSGAERVVTVTLTDVSYNFPASSPLNFTSFVNQYAATGSVLQTTVQGQIDNSLNGSGTVFSPVILNPVAPPTVTSSSVSFNFNDPEVPPAFTIITTIAITLNSGASVSIDAGSMAVPSPVPAPSSCWLVLAGSPVVGLAAWVRRRRRIEIAVAA